MILNCDYVICGAECCGTLGGYYIMWKILQELPQP